MAESLSPPSPPAPQQPSTPLPSPVAAATTQAKAYWTWFWKIAPTVTIVALFCGGSVAYFFLKDRFDEANTSMRAAYESAIKMVGNVEGKNKEIDKKYEDLSKVLTDKEKELLARVDRLNVSIKRAEQLEETISSIVGMPISDKVKRLNTLLQENEEGFKKIIQYNLTAPKIIDSGVMRTGGFFPKNAEPIKIETNIPFDSERMTVMFTMVYAHNTNKKAYINAALYQPERTGREKPEKFFYARMGDPYTGEDDKRNFSNFVLHWFIVEIGKKE